MDTSKPNENEGNILPSTSGNPTLDQAPRTRSCRGDRRASQAVINETNSLYFTHLIRQVNETGVRFPFENRIYIIAPRNASSLQALADRFILSPRRQWVHEQAQNVDLDVLNFNTFQQLLNGLFQEGETWETVLILFYFCTDLSVRALQERRVEWFIVIYNWTTAFISSKLSTLVEEEGGWDVVLKNPSGYVTKLAILGVCCIGILAICIYIRNRK